MPQHPEDNRAAWEQEWNWDRDLAPHKGTSIGLCGKIKPHNIINIIPLYLAWSEPFSPLLQRDMLNRTALTRWIFILASVLIISAILWNTYSFFNQLKDNERSKMELWASAQSEFEQTVLDSD